MEYDYDTGDNEQILTHNLFTAMAAQVTVMRLVSTNR